MCDKEEMKTAVLSFGSNTPDKRDRVEEALEWAGSLFSRFEHSSEYETQPLSGKGAPYMNAVGVGKTPLSLEELTRLTKYLEERMGRDSSARERGEVPIDIDIVVYDDEVVRPRDFSADFFKRGYEELSCY